MRAASVAVIWVLIGSGCEAALAPRATPLPDTSAPLATTALPTTISTVAPSPSPGVSAVATVLPSASPQMTAAPSLSLAPAPADPPATPPLATPVTPPPATAAPASPVPVSAPPAPTATVASRCVEDDGELRYPHGGTTVRGALTRPQGAGPFPAALVLHTRGGLNAHAMSEASWLASQGFIAYAPDYFTPIGVSPLTFDRQTFTARYSDAVRDLLAGAIACLRERGDVDRARVGVVGFSMGGYFAAILASRDDVNAAAAWYAAYAGSPANNVPAQHSWTDVAAGVRRPLLLLHGDADQDVRIDFARRAAGELQRLGRPSELVVYPGAGHGYDQEGSSQYRYDAAATTDSRARTLTLLRAAR